jgi:hypothetical protein
MTRTPRVAAALRRLATTGTRILILYGEATTDSYIGEDYQIRGLDAALWYELRDLGFERVVFGRVNDQVYFLDASSLSSLRSDGEPGTPVPMTAGPLMGMRPQPGPVTAAAGQAAGRDQRSRLISDIHAIRTIAALLRDTSTRTAAVIVPAESYLAHVTGSDPGVRRSAEAAFDELITTADSINNKNVLVLVFDSDSWQEVMSSAVAVDAVSRFAQREGGKEEPRRAIHRMAYPDADELERLVHRLHHRRPDGLRVDSWTGLGPVIAAMEATRQPASRWPGMLRPLADAGIALSIDALRARELITSVPGGKSAAEQLAELTGLDIVKQSVRELMSRSKLDAQRRSLGMKVEPRSLHLAFTGNPGTGKTTVARLMGDFYREAGLLSRGHVRETTGRKLIGQFIGQTGFIAAAEVDAALDGVLFIDEAYGLVEGSDAEFGRSALNELVERMENERGRLAVVFAGYPSDIERLLATNDGLPSRIPRQNRIHFPDYTPDELLTILRSMIAVRQMTIDPALEPQLRQVITGLTRSAEKGFGNARAMRDLMESLEGRWAMRIDGDLNQPLTDQDLNADYRTHLAGPTR